jgi:hypothetical protein
VAPPDGVGDTAGATAASFAAAGCGSGVDGVGATEATFAAAGCGSSAADFVGFAGLVDTAVKPGRRGLWRVCGFGASFLSGAEADGVSAVVVLSSVLVEGPVGDSCVSGFDVFGPGEPSELEVLSDDDGSSARATPLPTPTATQADSKRAATENRSHQ